MALISPKLQPASSSIKPLAMILCIFLYRNVAAVTLPTNGTIPAVFAVGDSTLDTGNNDYIISGLKSNFPPLTGETLWEECLPEDLAMEESPQT